MSWDCDTFANVLIDAFTRVGWPASRIGVGGTILTGEQGIRIISQNPVAEFVKRALQAGDAGGLPAEFQPGGTNEVLRILIGDRP